MAARAAMWQTFGHGDERQVERPVEFFIKLGDKSCIWRFEPGQKVLFRVKGAMIECKDQSAARRKDGDV